MSVSWRLAGAVLLTGLASALGVIVTVALAFQRFEHESIWQRGDAFVERVTMRHDDLLDQQQRRPQAFAEFLRNLMLYEPDSQLYLLDADGTVLAHSSSKVLPPGLRVKLAPVREAVAAAARGDRRTAAYVMGEDPESDAAGAVVAARPLRRTATGPADAAVDGYLYLVCRSPGLPASRRELLRSSLLSPALASAALVFLLMGALAAWTAVAVTRPLRRISQAATTASVALSNTNHGATCQPRPNRLVAGR